MLPQAPLFQFQHGDHICVFYRTETALLEILTPYIAEGLRKGERCFCVQTNEVVRRLTLDLQFIGVNVERDRARRWNFTRKTRSTSRTVHLTATE